MGSERAPRVRQAIALLLLLTTLTVLPAHTPAPARAQTNGSHVITWDSHSLLIDGRRVLIDSGEFHYWRLPSESAWRDRLEKMKAAGLNAVSVYFSWQYHSFAPDTYDFSGIRDIDHLLTIADQLGLYVIARVGPYMNAEADAGGLPGWLLAQPLFPRSQSWDGTQAHEQYSALYSQYSREWYDHLLPILARHQATDGKSVLLMSIENEYSQIGGSEQYMRELYSYARADGIRVPIFHNDFYFRGDWSRVVDLYAYDSYPYGFNCCHQWYDLHFDGVDAWEHQLRQTLNVTTPMFVSELQGGAFDPWGGVGYERVAQTLGAGWLTSLDQSALAQGTTLLNTYMFTGGTTWGYMGEPGVYTSYDYGAPISEAGQLRPSYYAAHRLAASLQTYGSSLAGADAAPQLAAAADSRIAVHARQNAQSGQFFVWLRHGDPGSPIATRVQLNLGSAPLTIPQKPGTAITIPGHDSMMLTGNVDVGPLHMKYSTSQILADASTAQGHYLVLYGPRGTNGETDFALPSGALQVLHNPGVTVTKQNSELRLNYTYTAQPHTVEIETESGPVRLLIEPTSLASRTWITHQLVIVGPDLVTDDGHLTMHAARRHWVEVYGAPEGRSLEIDGRATGAPDQMMGRTLLGWVRGPGTLALPALATWKFHQEAPEIDPAFDDLSWVVANHASTNNPNVPKQPSLLADDYGFHYGFVWYRGHFTASGTETAVVLEARQSYSVYLNGTYLGSADESLADPPHAYATPRTFTFPAGVLRGGADNVISVLTESLGHDEGWLAGPLSQSPQGLLSATLAGSASLITWRLQGDQGGETPADSAYGIFNASGLFGERQGWYRTTFDDATWSPVSLPDNWTARGVTSPVGWYRTRFTLHVPTSENVAVGLTIPHASDKAVIWCNGLLVGRYWEQRGPQHLFYLPSGVLRTRGQNTIAIAVWNRGHLGGLTSQPQLTLYGAERLHTLGPGPKDSVDGFWHTAGNRIVDASGTPVRISAVNWAGMQNRYYVPAGLDRLALDTILARVRALGFNAIRLPFSNELVEKNPIVRSHLDANPSLQGLHALDVMDRIIAAARSHGVRVILENHRSSVGTDPEENGLWYTAAYPESTWIRDWKLLAERYRDDPTVIGVDLRNEPHTAPPGPWSLGTYLRQGATWGPYRGVDNPRTDWRLAAERGGNAVLGVNPHLLVFVEGVQQYPDASQSGGLDTYWWGGILSAAGRYPVRLSVEHQLVYSPHEYGPFKYRAMTFFGPRMSYASMSAVWLKHWAYLESGPVAHQTPIFIGEFGTCGNSPKCVNDSTPGSQGLWFRFLMRYLREHPEINWSFWALNGTNADGTDQPNYILGSNWQAQRMHQLVDSFHDIESAPPPERN